MKFDRDTEKAPLKESINKPTTFKLEDLLTLINYFDDKYELTESDIIKYDHNNDGNVNLEDFVLSIELLLKGDFKDRSPNILYILKRKIKEMLQNTKWKAKELKYLNREFKGRLSKYLDTKEYNDAAPVRKQIYKQIKTLEKKGFNLSYLKKT